MCRLDNKPNSIQFIISKLCLYSLQSNERNHFTDLVMIVALTCEPTTFKTCKDLGFNYTKFPNAWGELDQNSAEVTFTSYFLPSKQCSKDFLYFVCSVQFQMCDNGVMKPPCRRHCNGMFVSILKTNVTKFRGFRFCIVVQPSITNKSIISKH